jgi:hypothetical protein
VVKIWIGAGGRIGRSRLAHRSECVGLGWRGGPAAESRLCTQAGPPVWLLGRYRAGRLQGAPDAVESGQAAALITAKLDRISRSVLDTASLMEQARHAGWELATCDLAIRTSTPAGDATASMMGVFNQLERRLISQRTREALAVRKSQRLSAVILVLHGCLDSGSARRFGRQRRATHEARWRPAARPAALSFRAPIDGLRPKLRIRSDRSSLVCTTRITGDFSL